MLPQHAILKKYQINGVLIKMKTADDGEIIVGGSIYQ
jgi:hypothetical protein